MTILERRLRLVFKFAKKNAKMRGWVFEITFPQVLAMAEERDKWLQVS